MPDPAPAPAFTPEMRQRVEWLACLWDRSQEGYGTPEAAACRAALAEIDRLRAVRDALLATSKAVRTLLDPQQDIPAFATRDIRGEAALELIDGLIERVEGKPDA